MINNISIGEYKLISVSKHEKHNLIINNALKENINIVISYLNIYTYKYYLKTDFYKSLIPLFFIPDGVGIFILIRIVYRIYLKFNERIVSTDFWNEVLEIANEGKYRCVIWGGKQNMESSLKRYFKNKYPQIKIIKICNGYSNDLKLNDLNDIDILILGLGTPKQEQWIINNYKIIKIPLVLLVGSAIDYWSGAKKRAPVWMQKAGMEWFYRLFQEPRRLWKRYVLGIPVFLFYVLVQKVKLMLKK